MKTETQEEILSRNAILARDRLLAVVDELDRKRHQLAHPMQLVAGPRAAVLPVAGTVIGAVALVAVGVISLIVSRRQSAKKKRRTLFQPRQPQPSFWSDVARRTAKGLIAFALIEAGKRAIRIGMKPNAQSTR